MRTILLALLIALSTAPAEARHYHHRLHHHWRHFRHHHHRHHHAYAVAAAPEAQGPVSGLLSVATRFLGMGNFTGLRAPWCAAGLGRWLTLAGFSNSHSNAAISYRRYGAPTSPHPGAIAVMPHHVGIVAAVHGDRITLLSANHGHHTVGYGVIRRSRVIAFRQPTRRGRP